MLWVEQLPSTSLLNGFHPLIAKALARRGITAVEEARAYLDPDNYRPTPACELPGLSSAADRIEHAIQSREPICVWGDFDVDGQTATTILFQTLLSFGADVSYHIPIREREGHGINIPYLHKIIANGIKLILTCDTGTTAHPAVEYAKSHGVEVIVTDHHDLADFLPPASAIINPKLLNENHPLATLSGAGVAYKLSEELYNRFHFSDEVERFLDIAVLGLVSDLACIKGDTRYLIQRGLQSLRSTNRLGIKIMMELAELNHANITEEHISFVLGPRLNALGRLGDANPVVELLSTSDASRARLLAVQLENYNAQRQLLTNQVSEAAEAQLRRDKSLQTQPIIILGHPSWPGGIIGIAAARLVERYHRPVILFSTPPNEPARGSARSIEGVNITSALDEYKELLLNYGGHPMAAGLSLEQENLPTLQKGLAKTVERIIGKAIYEEPQLQIDAWLDLNEASLELAETLEQLAPYGPGNKKLTLATHNLRLHSASDIGKNHEHLKFSATDRTANIQQFLWWNGAGETFPEGEFDLAYNLRASDWHGSRQVQLEYVDCRALEEKSIKIKAREFEIVDFRMSEKPIELLNTNRSKTKSVWAEGNDKKKVNGQDRNELERAESLAIWTTPPSPEELQFVLEKVKPRKLYLYAIHPDIESIEDFLKRLTGLLKYAIHYRDGKAAYADLAAATAQRIITVQKGLQWLIAQGVFKIQEKREYLLITKSTAIKNHTHATQLHNEILSLFEETIAYRNYFLSAEKNSLLIKNSKIIK